MMPTDGGEGIVAFGSCSALDDLRGLENGLRRSGNQFR